MNIYLMRHGQKGYRPEMPLTPSGVREAESSAHKLGELGIGGTLPGIILSSPLPRAAETARITGAILKIPVYACVQLETWGLSSQRVPELPAQLRELAEQNQPDLDASTSIIAVTHEPLITAQLNLSSIPTGHFIELPSSETQQQAA